MKRCMIITAYQTCPVRQSAVFHPDDFIICADGGYEKAIASGIVPDLVIGDFDSGKRPNIQGIPVISVPCEKDDTDTALCFKHGIKLGYDVFGIVGGIGGRIDHSLANLALLSYACDYNKYAVLLNESNIVTMIDSSSIVLPRREGFYLSLLAYSDYCKGVSESGVKYPLNGAFVDNSMTLGVSNEITEKEATISVEKGKLLVIYSRDFKA